MIVTKSNTKVSASMLFEQLKNERAKLIASKTILDKKDNHKYPITDVPFKIPSNWIWCYLSDISLIQEGPGIRKHQYATSGIQFLTVTNILEGSVDLEKSKKYISKEQYKNYAHFTINKGDIVTACSGGSWGKSAIYELDDKLILNTSTLRLRFYNDLGDNYYLYYLTKTNYFKDSLSSYVTGQQPNYGYSHYSKIPIPLPPLSEQKLIVTILDEAFSTIAKAKTNAEQNLKNTKELFESYLQGVFENPNNNWQKKKLGDVCGFVRGPFGGSLKKSIFKPEGFAVYEQQHAIYDQFDDLRYFIDEKKFNEMKRFELNSGDLIMSCSGTMGKIAIVPENIKRGIINQALLKLSPSQKVSNVFLKLWMQSESFQNSLKEYAGGAAIQNVASVAILKNIEIPLPDISIQNKIVQRVQAFSSETKKLEAIYQHKINDLEELKKSVLQKAFSGELKTAKALV
jgi:type I restriction enzyme S subunit